MYGAHQINKASDKKGLKCNVFDYIVQWMISENIKNNFMFVQALSI